MPPWLAKVINHEPLRSGDQIARRRLLGLLSELAHLHSAWRNAKLPVAAAAE